MKLYRYIIFKIRYIFWRNILFDIIFYFLMLIFLGTFRVFFLIEVLWDRLIRGFDGWYRILFRVCKVFFVILFDSFRVILMNRRIFWRSDLLLGIDGCIFRNLLEKNWKFLIFRFIENFWYICIIVEYSKNFFLIGFWRYIY